MAIVLRRSYQYLTTQCAGKYGLYKSTKMKNAFDHYKAYEDLRNDVGSAMTAINQAQMALINSWYIWSSTSEFRKTDKKVNGLLTEVAVEITAIPNHDREQNTNAFILFGVARDRPTRKQAPRVEVTDKTVPALMYSLKKQSETYAVVMIDAFGGESSIKENGFSRRYGTDKATVLENIETVLEVAKEHDAPIINVTMGASKTWKNLTDRYSTQVVDVVKPAQPLFKGKEEYRNATLKNITETGATNFVVVGWDANQCVAAAIFGVEPVIKDEPFVPGLIDFGWNVITARNLLGANQAGVLESTWGWPYIPPSG